MKIEFSLALACSLHYTLYINMLITRLWPENSMNSSSVSLRVVFLYAQYNFAILIVYMALFAAKNESVLSF